VNRRERRASASRAGRGFVSLVEFPCPFCGKACRSPTPETIVRSGAPVTVAHDEPHCPTYRVSKPAEFLSAVAANLRSRQQARRP